MPTCSPVLGQCFLSLQKFCLRHSGVKNYLHLELLPYLPPWSYTQLPRRRCCCWQQQTPLPHTLSHGCKREDRDTTWTPANVCAELSWITLILVLPHSQLLVLQRKTIPWQNCWVLYLNTWISSFLPEAGDHGLPLCSISHTCSEVNTHTYTSFSCKVIQTFSS